MQMELQREALKFARALNQLRLDKFKKTLQARV